MTTLLFNSLLANVKAALKAWKAFEGTPENFLENLLLVKQKRAETEQDTPYHLRYATNHILLDGIQTLQDKNEEGARILTGRFIDGKTALKVGLEFNESRDWINKQQKKALNELTHILLSKGRSLTTISCQ